VNDLLARLIAAGTPAHLVAEVAMELGRAQGERDALERRRSSERERQQAKRERDRHVMPRDVTDVTSVTEEAPSLSPSPLLPPDHQQPPAPIPTPVTTTRARKEPDFELPERIPAAPWRAFVEMRKRIGKPMSDYAMGLAVAKLDKLASDGWPPGEVLNNSTLNSYQGLFPPKGDRNERNQHHRPANDEIRDPMARAVLARQAERASRSAASVGGYAGDWSEID